MFSIAAVCLVAVTQAQAPNQSTTLVAARQKLALFNGDWTYETVVHTTPIGPGDKASGKMTCSLVLRGFASECLYEEKGSAGVTHGRELMWYDAATKTYAYTYHDDAGYIEQGPWVVTSNGTTWKADTVSGDKAYKVRGIETFSPDGRTSSRKAEVSVDGKTWLPYTDVKLTKVTKAKK